MKAADNCSKRDTNSGDEIIGVCEVVAIQLLRRPKDDPGPDGEERDNVRVLAAMSGGLEFPAFWFAAPAGKFQPRDKFEILLRRT